MNTVQDIQMELIRRTTFNNFNGTQIAKDLENHKDLWIGVIFDRMGDLAGRALIKLRDISKNHWNADTLYVLVPFGKEQEFEKLAQNWEADDISLMKDSSISLLGTSHPRGVVYEIWWD